MSRSQFSLILALLGLLIFLVSATEKYPIKHKYLPEICSQPYIPTSTEWKSLHLTAEYNCEMGLTDKLIQTHFSCYPYPEWFYVIIDLKCQPTWNHYLGNGAFDVPREEVESALLDGVRTIMRTIQVPMPNVTDEVVKMDIYMRGFPIAVYQKGKLQFQEGVKFKS